MKKIFIPFIFILILFSLCFAEESGTISNVYKLDGSLDTYRMDYIYSPLAKGINSVRCNPAGIMNVQTFEVSIKYIPKIDMPDTIATVVATDEDIGEMGGDDSPMKAGIYFTDDPNDTSTFETRNFNLAFDYLYGGGISDFGLGFKIGEDLAFGLSRRRPAGLEIDFDTKLPAIFKGVANFYDKKIDSLTITSTGYAVYDDGSNPPITSSKPLWEGFLTQESYSLIKSDLNMSNQILDKEELLLTFGGKTGGIKWGVNVVPISSRVVFNNRSVVVASTETGEMKYWVPNFTDYSSAQAWFANELYTMEAGYTNYSIIVPQDQKVYNIEISGDYQAEMIRMDLGLIWDLNDYISIGAALENVSGQDLIYRGKGLVATAESYLTGEEPPSFEVGGGSFNPFTTEAKPIKDTENWSLSDEYVIQIPRKLKFGAALKKPIVLAVDYERYLDEIKEGDITVTDLGFLRAGLEMQILFLPLKLKGDSKWLIKPTIYGLTDEDEVKRINDLFSTLPLIPLETYFGISFPIFGYEFGGGVRENHGSIFSIYSGKLLDFLKVLSYDLYLRTDSWDITYTALAEPFYNVAGNTSIVEDVQGGEEVSTSKINYYATQTISFTFRF